MPSDLEANSGGDDHDTGDAIRDGKTADWVRQEAFFAVLDTDAIAGETKDLVVEAKSSLVVLICTLLIISLLSILLSTWLAKTITHSQTSFTTILSRYFGFARNETEQTQTWWRPIHIPNPEAAAARESSANLSEPTTTTSKPVRLPYSDYPGFHTIVLPLLFIGAIVLAVLAYYARIKCTHRNFAWGAVPKMPIERVNMEAVIAAATAKGKEAQPDVDYTIVQGANDETVVFALAETLQPLNEERPQGSIVDEATQYNLEDVPK